MKKVRKLEKILFVVPEYLSGRSFLQPPIDILLSSRILKNKLNLETYLIDNRIEKLELDELQRRIENISPDVIVISTSPYDVSQNYFVDFRIYTAEKTIRHIKKNLYDIPLIIVGPHGSIRPDILLKDTEYLPDYIIKWEYEYTLEKLLGSLKNDDHRPINKIPNIIINENGKIIETGFDEEYAHPKNFPVIPDTELIRNYAHKYYGDVYIDGKPKKKYGFGILLFQRGCPYRCKFCFRFMGSNRRAVDDSKKIEETIDAWDKVKIKDFFVLDYNFTYSPKFMEVLSEIIKNYDISFSAQTRCDLINSKTISYLKKLPITLLWLGIESFDDNIIRRINKYRSSSIIEKSISTLKSNDIPVGGFIQFGLPGENIHSLQRTINKIWEHKLSYTKSIIIHGPLYGTESYKLAKKQYEWIGNDWNDISTIRGLVDNEMTPGTLIKLVGYLRSRSIFHEDKPPDIRKILEYE